MDGKKERACIDCSSSSIAFLRYRVLTDRRQSLWQFSSISSHSPLGLCFVEAFRGRLFVIAVINTILIDVLLLLYMLERREE